MPEAAFGQKLGPDTKGVKAVILAGSDGASLLRWPFYKVVRHHAHRVRAAWVKPGAKRPVWGESPPPVADVPQENAARLASVMGAQTPAELETAVRIAIDAGVLSVCGVCGQTVRTDVDAREAYKLGNLRITQGQHRDVFPSRRAMTDAIQAVVSGPTGCTCDERKSSNTTPTAEAVQEPKSEPTTHKVKNIKAPTPTLTPTKPAPQKPREDESDPFGDLVGGALIDTVVPGASVIADLINTVTPDANAVAATSAPGIPEPEPDGKDENGAGHEPEAGD